MAMDDRLVVIALPGKRIERGRARFSIRGLLRRMRIRRRLSSNLERFAWLYSLRRHARVNKRQARGSGGTRSATATQKERS